MSMLKKKKNNFFYNLLSIVFFESKFLKLIFEFPRIFVLRLISIYRKYLSPLLPPTCRFYPSCSKYAEASFKKHGFWRGFYYTFLRVLKCNPLNPGGFDPVIRDDHNNYNKFKKH